MLQYLELHYPHGEVTLKKLSYKLVMLLAFAQNEKLCIVSVLNEYLRRTKEIRGEESKLLLSYQAPHMPVSKNTLARWLRQVFNGAGVDTARFSAHGTRTASTSAALFSGVPVDVVLRAAGCK